MRVTHSTVRATLLTTLATCVLAAGPAIAQQGATGGEWRSHSGDNGATKYSPLDQINEDNVGDLQIAWRRLAMDQSILDRAPDLRHGALGATPLMIDGVLYLNTPL